MVEDIVQVWFSILSALEDMSKEATAHRPEYGLRCYALYRQDKFPGSFEAGPNGERQWEEAISEGLACKLCGQRVNGKAIYALAERRYPRRKKRCDVVIWLDEKPFLWIECKVAYRENIDGDLRAERGSKNWPSGGWDKTISTIGGENGAVKRLEKLKSSNTQYVGVLLLGFDRAENPIQLNNPDRLPTEIETQPWIPAHRLHEDKKRHRTEWPDCCEARARQRFRERVWFWYRRVGRPAEGVS